MRIPFSQTVPGAILVAVAAALIVIFIQKTAIERSSPATSVVDPSGQLIENQPIRYLQLADAENGTLQKGQSFIISGRQSATFSLGHTTSLTIDRGTISLWLNGDLKQRCMNTWLWVYPHPTDRAAYELEACTPNAVFHVENVEQGLTRQPPE